MTSGSGVVAFIAVLAVMIVVHEAGHLYTAKRFGMKVEAFFFGFGPKLFSWTRGETEYGMRLLPFGGYVKIAGMNPFMEVPDGERPRTFAAKPKWQRAVVLSAGSATHFVLGLLLLIMAFGVFGLPGATTVVEDVSADVNGGSAPAREAGVEEGDRIVAVDGRRVEGWESVVERIRPSPGEEITLTVERGGEERTLTMIPAEVEVSGETIGRVGIRPVIEQQRQAPHVALWSAVRTTGDMTYLSLVGVTRIFSPSGLSQLFSQLGGEGRRPVNEDQPIGPVGIGQIAGQTAAQEGPAVLVLLLAGVVIFVGVINLFPVPLLDGGYLAVLAFEKLTRREVDLRKLIPAALVVLVFFIVFTVTILYLDITRPVELPF